VIGVYVCLFVCLLVHLKKHVQIFTKFQYNVAQIFGVRKLEFLSYRKALFA